MGTDTSPVQITVTPQARNPVLSMAGTLRDVPDGRAATYRGALDIATGRGDSSASVSILPMTTVTGPVGWDGVLRLPTFTDVPPDWQAPPGTITSMIAIGLDEAALTFDRPVRIMFHDRAGQHAGFERAGQTGLINTVCLSDGAEQVASQLGGTGDCRIDAGSDLAVWTFHFTRFYTLLPPAPAEPAAQSPFVRGGGGGGGGSTVVSGGSGQASHVYIRSVSWDCEAGTVTVEAGPYAEGLAVTVLSKTLGLSAAKLKDGIAAPGYVLFVAPMDREDDFIQAKALSIGGRDFASATEFLNLDSCAGTKTFQTALKAPEIDARPVPITPMQVQADAPTPLEQAAVPDPTPNRAAEDLAREPEIPAQTAEPTQPAQPVDICGPGTVMDSDGTCQPAPGGGCLVATAAHGTELAVQVQRLREVRQTVLSSESGAEFMGAFNRVYYSFSPAVADMERQNPVLREAVRIALAPMMATLQMMEFADTEARAVALGILAISLNVAMYGSPAALAILARRRRNACARPKPLGRAARQ